MLPLSELTFMRIPFTSLAFPLEAADRLASLLPALSLEQARDWTAQVYGYQNWCKLAFAVEAVSDPAVLALTPELKYALDTYTAGWAPADASQRTEFQLQKLHELMGWTERAAEHLYRVWEPRTSGVTEDNVLAKLGEGTPAYRLVQRDVFPKDDGSGVLAVFESGQVHLGYPGNEEKREAALNVFLAVLRTRIPQQDRTQVFDDAMRAPMLRPELRPVGGRADTWAQVLPMTFVACSERDHDVIVGVAALTVSLVASRDGTHSARISLERLIGLKETRELQYAFSEAMAVAVWETVSRYLWCTLGNVDKAAHVVIEHRPSKAVEKACASDMYDLIQSYAGWPNTDDRPERYGIKFELTQRPVWPVRSAKKVEAPVGWNPLLSGNPEVIAARIMALMPKASPEVKDPS